MWKCSEFVQAHGTQMYTAHTRARCVHSFSHTTRFEHAHAQATFHKAAIIVASHSNWGGHHHVEVHPDYWWITRMEMQGFVYSERMTKLVRTIASATKQYSGTSEGQHISYTSHV
jgi:hypothetical protein